MSGGVAWRRIEALVTRKALVQRIDIPPKGASGSTGPPFAARCRAQVVSRRKAASAASMLMPNFHRNVRSDGTRAASARQEAIVPNIEREEYRHPFYWAGFVVPGDAL